MASGYRKSGASATLGWRPGSATEGPKAGSRVPSGWDAQEKGPLVHAAADERDPGLSGRRSASNTLTAPALLPGVVTPTPTARPSPSKAGSRRPFDLCRVTSAEVPTPAFVVGSRSGAPRPPAFRPAGGRSGGSDSASRRRPAAGTRRHPRRDVMSKFPVALKRSIAGPESVPVRLVPPPATIRPAESRASVDAPSVNVSGGSGPTDPAVTECRVQRAVGVEADKPEGGAPGVRGAQGAADDRGDHELATRKRQDVGHACPQVAGWLRQRVGSAVAAAERRVGPADRAAPGQHDPVSAGARDQHAVVGQDRQAADLRVRAPGNGRQPVAAERRVQRARGVEPGDSPDLVRERRGE